MTVGTICATINVVIEKNSQKEKRIEVLLPENAKMKSLQLCDVGVTAKTINNYSQLESMILDGINTDGFDLTSFPNLTYLSFSNIYVEKGDFSKAKGLKKLEVLSAYWNKLTEVNVTKTPKLLHLTVKYNKIKKV